jgi:hypothetical protein
MKVGIIILNYRTAQLCADALATVVPQARACEGTQVIVVDNASPDDSCERLADAIESAGWQDVVQLMPLPNNGGFSAGNNAAIERLLSDPKKFDALWLLNPDILLRDQAMQELVSALTRHPDWGIAGSRLEDPDGTSQRAARRFPSVWSELESTARTGIVSRVLRSWSIAPEETNEQMNCDWLPGASLLIRREVFDSIGLLDAGYFMYYEEVDFCRRAKQAGFQVGYVPSSRVIHLVGQASGVTTQNPPTRKRRPKYWFDARSRYFLKHHGAAGLVAADLAWLFGQTIGRLADVLRRRRGSDPPWLIVDFLRHMTSRQTWNLSASSVAN